MAVPDFQSIMLPLLELASDGKERSLADSREAIAEVFNLSQEEREELLPSGTQPVLNNRVAWASIYLQRAGILSRPRRGWYQITDRGREVLREKPPRIDIKYLERFPEFRDFRANKKEPEIEKGPSTRSDMNPEEALEIAYQSLQQTLASEIMQSIKDCSPQFFERLVIDVLVKMGYGGSRKEAGQAVGRRGDEGIDGIIKEDKLGLDIIYIQAKRWEASVGRPEIQKFAGALQGQRARKGIFITTSTFSREATDYVKNIESKIILIDGQRLAELMIEHDVGVSPVASYEIKKIDSDYFIED
ncbi:MAG: restriction endonuclease [Deltaproteobacteria bacterium]|nr:restriction endonuclease [Deltaproteobacteria bacterium]